MSEENNIGEVLNLVEEAQKRGKFNLADVIKERAYPEKQVTIYTDSVAAQKLYELDKEMDKAAFNSDVEGYAKLSEEADELVEKVKSSKLVFRMMGLSQVRVDEIGDTLPGEQSSSAWSRDYVCALVAASIKSVENADGDIDSSEFSLEDAKNLYALLPAESWNVLADAVQQLTLATGIFKGITDAGFLQRS